MNDLAELQPPILSALDPVEVGEGSVDPLLLQKVYEHMAERILPSLTVRMQRVRFLTAVAAGTKVCECFDPDEMAADGVTPPWLVCEWYVAEALVRASAELGGTYGLPGRLKIEAAWRDDRSISTRTRSAERRALRDRLGRVDRENGADPAAVHVRREIVERVEKGRRVGGDEEPETGFLRSLAGTAASSDLAVRLGAIDA